METEEQGGIPGGHLRTMETEEQGGVPGGHLLYIVSLLLFILAI